MRGCLGCGDPLLPEDEGGYCPACRRQALEDEDEGDREEDEEGEEK